MFQRISIEQAKKLIEEQRAAVVDIRDPMSFEAGHIPDALALSQDNLRQWMAGADKNRPLLVCCYHGNSSQPAAQFLAEQGFADVYSIDGGFEAWRSCYEMETGA